MSRLVIFLMLYFCIYGSAHLYLLVKARRAFHLQGAPYFLLFVVFIFLLLAPINARLLESQGHWRSADAASWIGFVWMGFIFIFVCLALPLDGYHLLVGGVQEVLGTDWTSMMMSKQQCIVVAASVTCAIMIFGAVAANRIKIEHIAIQSSKITKKTGRIRIVQISDLHMGPMFYPRRRQPVIDAINQAKPDILVSTGDLIDGNLNDASAMIAELRSIHAPMGKYAVNGNHEYYAGISQASDDTQKAGFTLLNHQSTSINEELVITGVDDPAGGLANGDTLEAQLLRLVPKTKFSLLLKHRPEVHGESKENFDLQLSGHTHKGQIFPFEWLVRMFYPLGHGLIQFPPDCHVYISRGTGTWGPPIRVLARPEITVIDLVPAADKIDAD